MALTIGDNFSYQGSKPLDSRLTYATIAEMKAKVDSTLYDGIMAYCKADGKNYQWKSTNEVDATLGKWREFESGASVTVDDELSDTSTNPVQNAVIKEALDGKADLVDGKVPAAQLPSYVDDVLEYEDQAHFPATGEAGKIYVALDTNKTYRWSGSAYTEISESLALGETSSTAYRGDRGKIAYDDSQANKAAIGDLFQLDTTEKSNLVGAINEVKGDTLTTEQMEDIKAAFNPSEGAPLRMMHYSTDEQVVGTWIDGKPLYQKTVIKDGDFSKNAWNRIEHGITGLKEGHFISGILVLNSQNNLLYFNIGGYRDTNNCILLQFNPTLIQLFIGNLDTNTNIVKCEITIRYTKTTD